MQKSLEGSLKENMDQLNEVAYIYALLDPISLRIRYIGRTINLERRYMGHINRAMIGMRSHKDNWIRFLMHKGLKPRMCVIERTTIEVMVNREKYWLSVYASLNLTNSIYVKGDGVYTITDQMRRKMSQSQKRYWENLSYEVKKAIIEKRGNIVKSEKVRDKIRKSMLGRVLPKETKDKLSKALTGRTISVEVKHKMSLSAKLLRSNIPMSIKKLRMSLISRQKKRGKTSKYLGVYFVAERNKWGATITYNGKIIHIGRYNEEKDAAKAYNIKAVEIYGPNAILNDVCTNYSTDYNLTVHNTWGSVPYRGVTNVKNKYVAQVSQYGYIGRYNTPEEAARAYDEKAIEIFGDKAILNFNNKDVL